MIEINNSSSLVCARCSGIYAGAFLGSIISFFFSIRIKNRHLSGAIALMLIDVLLVTIGVYEYQKTIAFFTGIILGCIAFLYLYEALVSLFVELKSGQKN